MSHQPPLHPGMYYHIYNRVNNGENIFIEERNYRYFLQLYDKYITPVAETYAYSLLRNHFHFSVRIKEEKDLPGFHEVPRNTVEGENLEGLLVQRKPSQHFSNFFNAYTKAINKAYNRTGSLFQKNFRRIPVTSNAYFTHLIAYIHLNTEKHGFVDDFQDWPYSSYQAIVSRKPTQLTRETVLGWFDGQENFQDFHRGGYDLETIAALVEDDFY
ncbi:MAG: hypothetical protein KJ638_05365 [Chloroflexi bacterium]|nr:hypothetical protein [Chloroflexota bacterium]